MKQSCAQAVTLAQTADVCRTSGSVITPDHCSLSGGIVSLPLVRCHIGIFI